MRVLFDTCVAIDVLQHREPFWKDSYNAFLAIANRRAMGFSLRNPSQIFTI